MGEGFLPGIGVLRKHMGGEKFNSQFVPAGYGGIIAVNTVVGKQLLGGWEQ